MKNYLVAYIINYDTMGIESTQISVDDNYIPSSDDMKTIKKKVIENNIPAL